MTNGVDPIPEGFHTVTPYLTVRDAASAIEFYTEAFGAKEIYRHNDPDGESVFGEIVIGDSPVMINDEQPEYGMNGPQSLGGTPVNIFLYVEDVDALFDRAIAAGATEIRPVEDKPEGDRRGGLTDPFGHVWWIATHIEDVPREEIQKRHDNLA